MTEQEFRDALKQQVGQTGLSSDRQVNVLAAMKGADGKMRGMNKMTTVLILAAVLLLGITSAVATGLNGVGWNGEDAEHGEYRPLAETEEGARLQELFNVPDSVVVPVALNLKAGMGEIAGVIGSTSNIFVSDLEEMQVWVQKDGSLRWMEFLPEGYVLKLGRVGYACSKLGGMELLTQETTDDGYLLAQFLIPDQYRYMCDYFVRLADRKKNELEIHVRMDPVSVQNRTFRAGDDTVVTLLTVPGMDHALELVSGGERRIVLYQAFHAPVYYHGVELDQSGWRKDFTGRYEGLTIEIAATDTRLSAADLLAIFGLTAE